MGLERRIDRPDVECGQEHWFSGSRNWHIIEECEVFLVCETGLSML